MTPSQFLSQLKKRDPDPVYLFLGPEPYMRDACRRALIERVVPGDERENGYTRFDLDEVELPLVLDDARSFSLFASNRLLWVASAEAAMPRTRGAAAEDEDGGKGGAVELKSYIANPTPGTVVVFDCSRFDFDGEDKARITRVQKFYSAIPAQVEFERFSSGDARKLAADLAAQTGLRLGNAELDLLVEVLGSDAARISSEIEKLSVYTGSSRSVTPEDIWNLVPNARATTIFALVNALARTDRTAALEALDTLVRDGEYLPLALTFLATQLRLALAAREAGLKNSAQIQAHFARSGIAMWKSRADQVQQTMQSFPATKLSTALGLVHQVDKALRDARPDDRTIMENLVFELS